MSIVCFGLSHQTAAVDVRERFAIPESALPEALARLKTMPGLAEGLIVSTCNRTEFYVTGEFRDSSAPAFFESFYRDFRAGDETHLFRLWANHCVRHLFQVAQHFSVSTFGELIATHSRGVQTGPTRSLRQKNLSKILVWRTNT